MQFPWREPWLAIRLALFMGSAEFVRSGFFVGFFPLFGLERLGLPLSYIGLLTSLHYGAEAFPKVAVVWLANRFPFGYGLLGSALLAVLSYWGLLLLPPALYPILAVAWGLAMAPLWPRLAAFFSQIARPGHHGRSVTYAWLIVAPMIGLGSFGVGFLSKTRLDLGQLALATGSVLFILLALSLFFVRFPPASQEQKRFPILRFAVLVVPAFLQNLAPHLLTTVLFPFLKQARLGVRELALPLLLGGLAFLALIRLAARYSDRRDPASVVAASALLAALGFGALAFGEARRVLVWTAPLLGAALALYIPGWNTVVVRSLPENERGEGWGAISTVSGAAIAAGPVIGALAWDLLGPRGPFLLGLALLLFLLLYYLFFLRRMIAGVRHRG